MKKDLLDISEKKYVENYVEKFIFRIRPPEGSYEARIAEEMNSKGVLEEYDVMK